MELSTLSKTTLPNGKGNIIVSGLQRSGTSLLMEMLKDNQHKFLALKKEFEEEEFFKELQKFYHESEFVDGVKTPELVERYSKTKNSIVKIFAYGIIQTPLNMIQNAEKIIVLYRDWRNHYFSWKNVSERNITSMIKKNEKAIERAEERGSIADYFEMFHGKPGVGYAASYLGLLLHSYQNKYFDRLVFVSFEELIDDNEKLKEYFTEELGMKLDTSVVDKDVRKFVELDEKQLKYISDGEFVKGFYDFMDKVLGCIREGKLGEEMIKECERWYKLVINRQEIDKKLAFEKYELV
jgi:hypothetical protein